MSEDPQLDARAISGDHSLDFIECLCGEAFNTTAAFVAHCEPDGMPVSGDFLDEFLHGQLADPDFARAYVKRQAATLATIDENRALLAAEVDRLRASEEEYAGIVRTLRGQLDVSPIQGGEGPWHCRQVANGPNPIVVCHREDMQAVIDRLQGAARACVEALDRADTTSEHPWLAVLSARDALREVLGG